MADTGRPRRNPGFEHEKVVFLLPSLSGGGAERVASLLFPYLSKYVDLTVVLLEDRRAYEIPADVKVIAFSGHLDGRIAHLLRAPRHLSSLIDLVRRKGVGSVLSFMEEANIINILASFATGHRAIISQRIVPRSQHSNKGILGSAIYSVSRILYPRADQVVTVSSRLRDILLEDFKLAREQVSFISNPVDMNKLDSLLGRESNPKLPKRYILHVGRLYIAQKGQDVLLRAFASQRDRWPDLSLVLVGEGPDRRSLENLINSLNLSSRVILLGWQENVAQIMRRAELFVLPSRYEGWPNVLVEAMACGCPVIATDCDSGPREILNGGAFGILIPEGDQSALAAAIEAALSGNGWSQGSLEQARLRAESYSVQSIAKMYVDLISK